MGGTWWQYSLRSVGNTLQQSAPPLQNAVPVVGLILVDDESGPVLPLADADAPWLWWEMADF
ncbi:MAG TPA: hypothetical protein VLV83_26225, partial [Acidobacteriota bacterium]|nr:hypothetical protein [Acidobacteriota bacterium]